MIEGRRNPKLEAVFWGILASFAAFRATGSKWIAACVWCIVIGVGAVLDRRGVFDEAEDSKVATDGGVDDLDDDLLPDGYGETTIVEVFIDAWREALDENGAARVYLVLLMALMTVASAPILPIFWALEQVGVYHVD